MNVLINGNSTPMNEVFNRLKELCKENNMSLPYPELENYPPMGEGTENENGYEIFIHFPENKNGTNDHIYVPLEENEELKMTLINYTGEGFESIDTNVTFENFSNVVKEYRD
jgi:hypothetical protein